MTLSPDDDQVLRMLAGANFGPDSSVVLPSGKRLDADEAQALTSVYAPDADQRRRDAETLARNLFVRHCCRPADAMEYAAWLSGHLAAGGKTSHDYDYDLPDNWYVLQVPDQMPSLYGALSFNLIVPVGVPFDVPSTFHGGCGHSHVYFMDGYRAVPGWFVPTYRDVRAVLGI